MKHGLHALFALGLVAALYAMPSEPGDAMAADCCRVVVKGCDKEMKVCVPGGCSNDNQMKARKAFEAKTSCKSSNVASYIGTCSNEKCEIDLR